MGGLWVADIYHAPYGCSVWPGWTSTSLNWPDGGEIDTFGGVNMRDFNAISLHTTEGCTQVNPVQTSSLVNTTDCNIHGNGDKNTGCIVDPMALLLPKQMEECLQQNLLKAVFQSGFSLVQKFLAAFHRTLAISKLAVGRLQRVEALHPQQLVFDITLCGDFARPTLLETCSAGPPDPANDPCYTTYVLGPASNYDNAYFDIASVKVFSTSGKNTVVSNTTNPGSSGPTASSTGGQTTTTSNKAVGFRGSFSAVLIISMSTLTILA
ncbi:hypothetical protein C8J56DRAFT_1093266 [Mycena floridula]|nr:hypothetical protein C8J56DRAFT_1093266 [Mycena floridula]